MSLAAYIETQQCHLAHLHFTIQTLFHADIHMQSMHKIPPQANEPILEFNDIIIISTTTMGTCPPQLLS